MKFDPRLRKRTIIQPPGQGVPSVLYEQNGQLFTEDGRVYVKKVAEDCHPPEVAALAALPAEEERSDRSRAKSGDDGCGVVATLVAADFASGGWGD